MKSVAGILNMDVPAVRLRQWRRKQDQNASKKARRILEQHSCMVHTKLH